MNLNLQLPSRALVLRTSKILTGSVAALVSLLSGQTTCAPNVFGLCYGMYLPFELMQFSITLLAASLLVSALKDIFMDMGRIALLDRDIESIADPINENLVLDLGIYDL